MSQADRKTLSTRISQIVPNIIQGAHLGFLAERAITHTQFFMLIAVHSRGQCPMKTIAANMHVSMPTVSGIVDRLVQAKFLRRYENLEDRRQVMVELTAEGKKLISQFQEAVGRRWLEVLSLLSDSDIKVFSGMIANLQKALSAEQKR